MITTRTCLLSIFLLMVACGDDTLPPADGGADSGSDAGGDAGTDSSTDAGLDGGSDAATDGAVDAAVDGASDAASDASADASADAGGCASCVGAELTWGFIGGFVVSNEASALSPCQTYSFAQEIFVEPMTTTTCTNEVPCTSTELISMADVAAALAHEDVVAAFAAAPITYGADRRFMDLSIFEVTQSGATFLVGSPCMGGTECIPIPPGVQALTGLLSDLDDERALVPDCSTAFP